MKTFSNTYIFLFTIIMVLIVAAGLSVVSMTLSPFQAQNQKIETYRNILTSLGVQSTAKDAETLYNQYIKSSVVLSPDGKLIDGKTDKDAADEENVLFAAEKDGKKYYIVPLTGKGLWGKIWGYVALESDMNTISGVVFSHVGETPGLGSEISTMEFQSHFAGKKFVNTQGNFVSVLLKKKGSYQSDDYTVDAVSGGTLTSNGVQDMLYNCLQSYQPYFSTLKSN